MRNIITIIITVCLTYITGCFNYNEYSYTETEESSDGAIYKCVHEQVELEENKIDNYFTLTKEPDDQNLSLHGEGKFQCMTLSEKGNLLCIAILPFDRATHTGYKYYSSDFELIFVNTDTLKESHRWRIKPKKKTDNREEYMSGFDEIDISDDGSLVITYILKDIKTVVNVWAVKTGEKIQEYYLNPENPALREKSYGTFISDLAISQNNDFIALAGFWAYLGRQDIDPGSYLYVCHIEDGTCKELHFKETYFIQKLCFDATGQYIACHSKTEIMIYNANESRLVHSQEVNNTIERINWNDNKKAFQIKIKKQTDIFISPEDIK